MDDDNFFKMFVSVWFGILLVNIAFWAVVIWAVIKLVNHYT